MYQLFAAEAASELTSLDPNVLVLLLGGGGLSIFILKVVLDFLKSRNTDRDVQDDARCQVCRLQVNDLHNWHSPDEAGEQHWKNANLTKIVDKMVTVVDSNTKAIDRLCVVVRELEKKVGITT